MYRLVFYAWTSHKDEVDYDEDKEYFSKEFDHLLKAKMVINGQDCILWDEGEWEDHYITISFNPTPKIYDADDNIVSECEITDYDDYEFDWIDR